tara:strand:+ start:2512 stop:2775 length:264 start_codon:yes stop_codon:yes gene_type:complete
MIIEAILKINPNAVVTVRGGDIDTCEFEWLENTTPILREDIKAQLSTVEAEFEQAKQDQIDLKDSAKNKLMNGEALTEDEANVMVGL